MSGDRTFREKEPQSELHVATIATAVELVLAMVVGTLVEPGGGSAMAVFLLPVLVAAAAILAMALVLPTASFARWAGARWGGHEAWWWVPIVAPMVAVAPVTAVALAAWLLSGETAESWAYLSIWLTVAVLLIPAALLARFAVRSAMAGRPVRMTRKILGGGCVGLVAILVVALLVQVNVDAAGP
ncbi:hypothetical protein [Streptomyces sp. SAJ15]|uniref:hypothetical protein n=1 Tax=Streptomyces sp. SAJ15 TaxID=2011095 RepID=UPI00118558A8|nr:hypothetical protein [Streptomyces sp. SAJ15]TVL87372.1 hypothetical protein CD790_33560 [Streptomyces sp. SAJ15]